MNSVTHAARLPDLLGIQRFDVPGCRLLHSGFALSINDTIPERPVNTLVAVGFDGLQDVVDFRSTERNEIRIAVHKADVLAICDDLNNIAAQQSSATISSLLPMQNGPACEVTSTTNELHLGIQLMCFSCVVHC
jgi:hypothetical protein